MPETRSERGLVLMDQPDDCYCEERGWVSTDVDTETARDLLTPFCFADDGMRHGRPVGHPRQVWLAPKDRDGERWGEAERDEPGAREFWEFDATDVAPVDGPGQNREADRG